MQFVTTVTLGDDDSFLYSPDAAAAQVLAALGGNPTRDFSAVTIQQHAQGSAGTPPPVVVPPPLPTEPPA